jgi:MFS family permease
VSDLSQALNALGLLLGSLIFSTTSDVFGRKKMMLVLNLACGVSEVVSAFTTNVYWYSSMRLMTGALNIVGYHLISLFSFLFFFMFLDVEVFKLANGI